MDIYVNLFFSILLAVVIMTFKELNVNKNKGTYKDTLYRKTRVIHGILYGLSLVLFIIFFILNRKEYNIVTSIINALSIALITIPLSINTLYKTSFKDEEKYNHTKYVITDDYDINIAKKLNRAGIKIIYLSSDSENKYVSLEELETYDIRRNIAVDTNDYEKVLKIVPDSLYSDSLEGAYKLIKQSRGVRDNYTRTIKFNLAIYGGLLFTVIAITVQKFPLYYNLFLTMLLKVLTYLNAEYVYKHLPFDTDLMYRNPMPENVWIGFQELFITFLEAFCICFAFTIPYMFILANGGILSLTYTILVITLLFIMLWLSYAYLSEKAFLVNIWKSFKSIRLICIAIGMILLTVIVNFIPRTGFMNIGLKNYFSALFISFIPIIFIEITKLARFTSKKGRVKNVKNNKKYKRS